MNLNLVKRDEEGNIQMYLQDLITCNKITIIQKLEVLFLINIRHILNFRIVCYYLTNLINDPLSLKLQ
jgi:hypothetical protein